MKSIEEIKNIVQEILENTNLFLVEVKLNAKNDKIDVYVDSLEGVNISTCIEINRKLEEALNREEGDFDLTVSSAGIGYPFKVKEQFLKNIGKPVEAKLTDNTKIIGTLKSYNEENVILTYEEKQKVEGKKKKEMVTIEKIIDLKDIKEIYETIIF